MHHLPFFFCVISSYKSLGTIHCTNPFGNDIIVQIPERFLHVQIPIVFFIFAASSVDALGLVSLPASARFPIAQPTPPACEVQTKPARANLA